MNRRKFSYDLLKTVCSYSLLSGFIQHHAIAKVIAPITDGWLRRLNDMSHDLKQGGLSPADWQTQAEELYAQISIEEITKKIDFEKLAEGFQYPDKGVHTKPIKFPKLTDLPDGMAFYSKLFGFRKDRAIIPHGHVNMASCHYVVKGEVSLKQYDKLEETDTHMLIKKTVDEIGALGSYSSISDDKNNIHWLKATSPIAHTFDVIVLDIAGKPYDINNIDPTSAEQQLNGDLLARKISVEEGLQKYGFEQHH